MKGKLFIFLLGSVFSLGVLADSTAYERLYQGSIINNPEISGDLEKAGQHADCHMVAMGVFPVEMQSALYTTATQTNDYQQSRDAFNQLVAAEMVAGGDRKTAIEAVIDEAQSLAESCLSDFK